MNRAPLVAPPRGHCLVVVLGDFGRDAALRFCTTLASFEREHLLGSLGPGAEFYDEYRRMLLVLQGQVAYVKEPFLRPFQQSGKALDSSVLVGFDGGLAPADVETRLGILACEAMAGPLARGTREVLVLLPCNTLAPVSWALQERFSEPTRLQAMLREAGAGDETLVELAAAARIRFPTVPEAVLLSARQDQHDHVLPLGTLGIAGTYREAARRLGLELSLLEPDGEEQQVVLRAIEATIAGEVEPRARAEQALRAVVSRHSAGQAGRVLAVEACTDLNYGVGLDSNTAYARLAVELVYGS